MLSRASTQKGFAQVVGSSLALIRGVENGVPISKKLAGKTEDVLGVDARWILGEGADSPIPGADGSALTLEAVRQRVKDRIAENRAVYAKAAKKAGAEGKPDSEVEAILMLELAKRYHMKATKVGVGLEVMTDFMDFIRKAKQRIAEAESTQAGGGEG